MGILKDNSQSIDKSKDKIIDLDKTVYELVSKYPEIIEIMRSAGFESITQKGMINTAGRFVTISRGAAMKNIPIQEVIKAFEDKGFMISGKTAKY